MTKKKDPGARRAQKNARRTTRKRRGTFSSPASHSRYLYDLRPPGAFYEEWDTPVGADEDIMSEVTEKFGEHSGEAATMRLILDYRSIYGPNVPVAAASQLDTILEYTDFVAQALNGLGGTPEETRESVHFLHAQGLLLINDDRSLWTTVPPGTPFSAPGGGWAFMERKAGAPPVYATVD